MTDKLKAGDKARIVQKKSPLVLGETLWDVLEVDGFDVTIREHGTNYRPQHFDASLLKQVA